MAASGSDRVLTVPILTSEKSCKKCKRGVLSAYVKCIECDVIYHRSCFDSVSQKVRNNCEMLNEMEIKCDAHPNSPLPEDVFLLKKTVIDLKKENQELKNENRKLVDELKRLTKSVEASTDISVLAKNVSDKVKQEVVGLFTNMEKQLNSNIQKELDNIRLAHVATLNDTTPNNPPTFSEITKRKNILIVKPKISQNSETTWNQLIEKVQPEQVNVGITKIKKLANGSVVIGCQGQEHLTKLRQATESVLENDYDIIKPRERHPRIKIVDISGEQTEETLKESIANQNPTLTLLVRNWKCITIKKMKKSYMAIFEVDAKSFHELRGLPSVFIKWSSCRVFEYFDVHRCYNCGGFNHNSAKCTEMKMCLNCGIADHDEKACTEKKNFCINCFRANKKFSLSLQIDHTRFDQEKCELLKRQVIKLREKTLYDS